MKAMFLVAIGGALGAVMRYGISMIPLKNNFPFLTLSINIIGAIAIGCIVGVYEENASLSDDMALMLKTGVCGGFTTFSTFSLEAMNLFENHRYVLGTSYAIISVVLCLIGVALGKMIARTILL